MKVTTGSCNDLWVYPFNAAIKGIGLNNGQLRRTTVEELIFGADEDIPGCPSHTKIPATHIDAIAAVRDQLIDALSGDDTLHGMIKSFTPKLLKSLTKMDKSIVLEHTFLVEHSERLLTARVRRDIMDAIPISPTTGKLNQAPQ